MRSILRTVRTTALTLLAVVLVCFTLPPSVTSSESFTAVVTPQNASVATTGHEPGPHDELASRDPLALLAAARAGCAAKVRDYCCVLLRQERIGGELTAVQRIAMRYRATPHSVYLEWLENAGPARRVTFVAGRDHNASGTPLAVVEPSNGLLRLVAGEVRIPIDGPRMRRSSRGRIDQAGFGGTFASLAAVNEHALERDELDITYCGTGMVDGRPTYVLERRLPYDGPDSRYPNGYLELHLDHEWLLPVGIFMYTDEQSLKLLGSYTMVKVAVNVGLSDESFEF